MPDRHFIPDDRRERPVTNVHHREILNIGAAADADKIHIAADHGVEPDVSLRSEMDIAHHLGAGRNPDRGIDYGRVIAMRKFPPQFGLAGVGVGA